MDVYPIKRSDMGNGIEILIRKKSEKKNRPWDEVKIFDDYDASPWLILDPLPEQTPGALALYCMQQNGAAMDIVRSAMDNCQHVKTPWGDIDGVEMKSTIENAERIYQAHEQANTLNETAPGGLTRESKLRL